MDAQEATMGQRCLNMSSYVWLQYSSSTSHIMVLV